MNLSKEVLKLNDIVKENFNGGKISFIKGDYIESLKDLINSTAPYGKIAFITFANTHQKYGKTLLTAINQIGCKLVSLIMPDKIVDSVDYAGLLFNLPEDVRFIFTMDKELCHSAIYFAGIRNLPFTFIPVSVLVGGCIDNVLYLKNGGVTDKIVSSTDKYVIIDKNNVSDEKLAKGYAHIISKAVALVDYRILTGVLGETFNKNAYTLLEKTIIDTVKLFSYATADRKLALLINGFKVEIASVLSAGKLFSYSAESFSCRIKGDKENYEDLELAFATKILKLYASFFGTKEAFPVMPDYNGRAEKVARLIKTGEKEIISAFIKHTQNFYKDKEKYVKAINVLKGEAEKLLETVNKCKSTYLALGGKPQYGVNDKDVIETVKYAGDTPLYLNGMTVLRELGVTDTTAFDKTV